MNELEKGLEVEVIELADRVGIAKSTAHNLLDKINGRLSEEGYPKRIKSRRADNRNHWRLVPALMRTVKVQDDSSALVD